MKKRKSEGEGRTWQGSTEVKKGPTSSPPPSAAARASVVIDFPVEGEILTSPHYAFRIGAGAAEKVEINIDDKGWRPCRASVGYWWFDWSGYSAGPHQAEARVPGRGRASIKSLPRRFTVLI